MTVIVTCRTKLKTKIGRFIGNENEKIKVEKTIKLFGMTNVPITHDMWFQLLYNLFYFLL